MTDIFGSRLEPVDGWHDLEIDPATNEHFRWTKKGFSLKTHTVSDETVLCLHLLSYFPSDEATLEIRRNGRTIETLRPRQGRRRYFVHMAGTEHEQSSMKLELHANREVPTDDKPGDSRELALRVYQVGLLSSPADLHNSDWVVVPTGPTVLSLETSNKCNFRCAMCRGTSDPFFFSGPDEFPGEYVEKVIGLARKAQFVNLHGRGEPLISQRFFQLLGLLYQEPPKVSFYTNGSFIGERILAAIGKQAIYSINFSLDAATAGTYQLIRNFDFKRVLANIRRVVETRERCGSSYPKVYLNMTLMRQNIQEGPLFVDLAKELGVDAVFLGHLADNNRWSVGEQEWIVESDDFTFDYRAELLEHSPSTSNFHLKRTLNRAKTLGVSVVLDRSRPMFFPETEDGSIREALETESRGNPSEGDWQSWEEPRYCAWPWEQLWVRSDGTVWFCCWKPIDRQDVPVGTLGEVADLKEIWNGTQIRKDRAVLALNGLPQACVRSPCWYKRVKR